MADGGLKVLKDISHKIKTVVYMNVCGCTVCVIYIYFSNKKFNFHIIMQQNICTNRDKENLEKASTLIRKK